MSEKVEKLLSGLGSEDRKNLLVTLASDLIRGMKESEKKEVLQNVLSMTNDDQRLSSMVER